MKPAAWPRDDTLAERLLAVDPRADALLDLGLRDLPRLLRAGDLLVVNDAATLPASLAGLGPRAEPIEARLLAALPSGAFQAVLFGGGDWRTPTERRAPPPVLTPGARLAFSGLGAVVERVSPFSPRLVELRFDAEGDGLWPLLYRAGRPVQYAHAAAPLELWHVQVGYASRPWASEMPSAGRPLRWELLLALRARGVGLARITHAAGLSSTGDAALDAALPLPERYDVPAATAAAVERAGAEGGRVVAVGTSVVRALEGAAAQNGGKLRPGGGETDLLLGPGYRPRVVEGILTGMHEPKTSHHLLLHAFAPAGLLSRAAAHADQLGYLGHEFGDSCLILGGVASGA